MTTKQYGTWVLTALILLAGIGCATKGPDFKEQVKYALDLYYAGEKAREAGNPEAAASSFRRSLEVSPRPIVHLQLAHVLMDLGQFEEAGKHLELALAGNPEYDKARVAQEQLKAKITVVERIGQPEKKQESLQPFPYMPSAQVKREAPKPVSAPAPAVQEPTLTPDQQKEIDALMARAQKALDENNPNEAIEAHKACVEIAPKHSKFHYYLANLYLKQGDLERAHFEYRQALDLNPGLAGAYNNLGVTYENMGRVEDAMAAYQEAIRVGDHTDSYYNLGVLLEKRGKWEDALKNYRIYLERDSGSSWAESARKQIRALERALY
ncbi:MAG TPA: tetratricopeptide repeat protein [bacterium]|nr:tetratricopeptide repeat protein [bacterium]